VRTSSPKWVASQCMANESSTLSFETFEVGGSGFRVQVQVQGSAGSGLSKGKRCELYSWDPGLRVWGSGFGALRGGTLFLSDGTGAAFFASTASAARTATRRTGLRAATPRIPPPNPPLFPLFIALLLVPIVKELASSAVGAIKAAPPASAAIPYFLPQPPGVATRETEPVVVTSRGAGRSRVY
jgi:hypothetical protein